MCQQIKVAKVSKIGLLEKHRCLWYRDSKVTYTAAQYPIWIIRNKEVIQISPEKMLIGIYGNDAT